MAATKRFFARNAARLAVQILFLALVVGGASLRNLDLADAVPLPELPGLCPLGATGNLVRIISGKTPLDLGKPFIWALLGILGSALIWGPVFCSWACPLGSVQELIGRLGRRVLGKRYNRIGPRLDRTLSYLRYAILALVVLSTLGTIGLSLDAINPSLAVVHAWTAAVPISALIIALAVLAASFFVERPWCRWLCPLGAIQGLIGRFSLFAPKRNPEACVSCGACDKACPMGVDVSGSGSIRDSRCNRCGRCAEACRVDRALRENRPRFLKK